ncbi:hypothetical protein [Nostoc sp. 'Peltigera membranacea cyanobiont' 232]|uniref:hypothetical protein n=1 Tax=Nostoc sp. 'Peltigera membranacea cyanobiont' 232 TaxID=2014531 RepID=UPI000B95A3BD|nr:hypothetical protein [Nostoc sp. 'Peltigera membranacea cyanobiont' 232]OYE02933.1 hypothetical protein CDG79_21350 [Nostoc sp. 'Peltigera membranacea cyanobiont' 232]
MSNYLYQLVAKSFNLIDTIQPLVLSVFEPLPESTLDWEPSMTTEETELETTSEAEKFPNFESVQSLESRSPATTGQIFEEITNRLSTNLTSTPVYSSRQIPELTPDLAEKPNFELSLGELFPESVLSQITTDNLLLTPNPELETNNPPLITAPTRLAHKQLTDIDSVVSSVQSPELRSRKQFLTQPFSESEMISPATNQVASSPNSDPFKPSPVAETKPSLSSRVVSVLTTKSNTSLLNPIDHQSQSKPESLSEKPIEINPLTLSLQSLSNTSLSNPIDRQSQPQPKSLSEQPIDINRLALSLQSPLKPDLQIYFDENLTVPFVLQEKIFLQPSLNTTIFRTAIAKENNAPVSRLVVEKLGELTTQLFNNQPIEINRVASLYTSPSDFSHYMDKSTRNLIPDQAFLLGNGENLKPLELQKRGLESEKFERRFPAMAEPMLRASKAFQERSFAEPVKSHTSPQVQHLPQSPTQVQTETSTILSIPSVLQQEKFATENLHKQPTEINQVFTHSLSPQVEIFELSPVQLQSEATAMSTTDFASASDIAQVLPLTPALAVETITPTSNTAIQLQEQLVNELPQQQPLQISGNISSPPVQKLISSEILSSQILEEPTAMSTTGFANAQSPDSLQAIAPIIDKTLSNSHKQTLTPTIDRETNVRLPHSKLASDLPEIPQRFVHKNVLSIQPLLTDVSPKLSSLQTNSSTASFRDNLSSFITFQPATQLAAIHSDIIPTPTPALHPSTAGIDIQPRVRKADSHLSDFRGNEASVQEVGSQNYNTNYHKHTGIQKTNRNEGIVSSPVDNLILPQNTPPNLSMSADRDKNGVQSSYFRQLEESDLRPLSGSINDMTVKSLSVIAASSKKDQKRYSEHLETPPVIQVTIGRLEVRSTAPVPPLPRPKPRPAPSVMSLNEYLQRRGGGKR